MKIERARTIITALFIGLLAASGAWASGSVSPASLAFCAQPGGANPPAQTLTVSVASGGSFTTSWSATVSTSSGGTWLGASPTSGSTTSTAGISVFVNTGGLTAGNYSGQVSVTMGTDAPINVPVTLSVTSVGSTGGSGSVSPCAVFFAAQPGGANPASQTLTVSAGSGGSFPSSWTAQVSTSSGGNWLTITPSSGSGSGSITVSANIAGLAAGTYSGQVSVTIASSTPHIVGVTLTVGAGGAGNVTPASLSFSGTRGGANPSAGTLSVSTSSGGSWSASVSTTSGGNWLSVSPASGSGSGTVSVSANLSGLAAGNYTGQVSVTIAGGAPIVIPVTLKVLGLVATPATLAFTAERGGANPAAQSVQLTASDGTLAWTATASTAGSGNWLAVSPASGSTPATLSISANIAGLSAGSYTGQVSIAVTGSAATFVTVALTVTESGAARLAVSPPFLLFQGTQGGATPAAQAISISNAGGGSVSWRAAATTNTGNWLALSSTQGTTPAAPTVSVNPAGLGLGVLEGLIEVTDVATGQTQQVTVALTVNRAGGTILLSQSCFIFSSAGGASVPERQEVRLVNTGDGTLAWNLAATTFSGGNWLRLDRASGASTTDPSTATPVAVTVNPDGLAFGSYYGLITASAAGATNSPQLASVCLTVGPAPSTPAFEVSPLGLLFVAVQGGANPAAQTVAVQNAGGGSALVSGAASTGSGGAWLSVSPASGSAPLNASVQVNVANLPAGAYRGAVTLSSGGKTREVGVLLVVAPSGTVLASSGEVHQAACTPSRVHALSTLLPNNFAVPSGWPITVAVRVVDDCGNPVKKATVVVSFSTGESAQPLSPLGDGLYTGTWVPLSGGAARVSIKALSPPLAEGALEINGQASTASSGSPVIRAGGVVNGASFARRAPVAPGSIVSLFGVNLIAQGLLAPAPLPRRLGGLSARIGDVEVPLFYAGPEQVNAQVPFEVSSTAASVVLVVDGKVSPPELLLISPAQPGVFTYVEGGVTRGAILDAQYATVGANNRVAPGGVIQIFATGLGPVDTQVRTGEASPSNPPARVTSNVEVAIGGVAASVQFAGLAPNFTGLYQVNAVVPQGLSGDVPLVLSVNGVKSNQTMLAVR